MKRILLFWTLLALTLNSTLLFAKRIQQIEIEGTQRVDDETITQISPLQKGDYFHAEKVKQLIKELHYLNYFSDIRIYQKDIDAEQVALKILVVEKPSITQIKFEGLSHLSEDDFKDLLTVKQYTILNENDIVLDTKEMEKKYHEKGYHLCKANYKLRQIGKNEVELTYTVDEGNKILVGSVDILGNEFYTTGDLMQKLAQASYTRHKAFSSNSLFKEDMLSRDVEFLSFYYRDKGFADVKVADPIVMLDLDKRFARITHRIEEGIQYSLGKLTVSGDIGKDLYTADKLLEDMKLKPLDTFRYSLFVKDIEMLVEMYGDLGYAYVDINPITKFDKESKLVDIDFVIDKGQKVYFGEIKIVGNTKTRNNVILRELDVHDGELYSGTKLSKSKKNIHRLGFFEEAQVIKDRDLENEEIVNLTFKVKEKATGQLQAAIGFSPGGEVKQSWFGQLRYDEKNQSGRGWNANVTGRYTSSDDHRLELGFTNPKVNDSKWSLGLNVSYQTQVTRYAQMVEIPEDRIGFSLSIGRALFELVRGSVIFKHSRVSQRKEVYIFDNANLSGIKNSVVFALSRKDLDNYLDPSDGTSATLSHQFTGGILGGNFQFMETLLDLEYYYPIDFSDTYRTYFRFHNLWGFLSPFGDVSIPVNERYRLGGFHNLRGFRLWSVGPKERRGVSPQGAFYDYNVGGDKQLLFQLEYFIPLIPQAGIKAIVFADAGRVYLENENIDFTDFSFDVGFGIRWVTPIAPFRFEWAFPYDNEAGKFGDMEFVFSLGY